MFRSGCLYVAAILFAGLLSACTGGLKNWNPDDYTVKSGDTVYSIAWRYELDPEEFADWNRLGTSRVIQPGQRLHTRKPRGFVSSRKPQSDSSRKVASTPRPSTAEKKPVKRPSTRKYSDQKWVKVGKGDTLSGIARRYGVSVERLAQLNQLRKPYVIQPGQTIFLKPLKTASSPQPVAGKTSRSASGKAAGPDTTRSASSASSQSYRWPGTVRWQRPARGKVIKKFNRHRNDAKGIVISGRKGDAIVAAASGKVVYSGDGLINYGNLIIIKHNNTFLSAYAYNRKLLVKEGEVVKAGQKVAEMGQKDKSSPRLHFEIRKNGKPVDPLKFLPR